MDRDKINSIVREVAAEKFATGSVRTVANTATIDSEGRGALRITIFLTAGSTDAIQGDEVLDALVKIEDRLKQGGEERFPIVEYSEAGDAQS
jgi:hypothetical protein